MRISINRRLVLFFVPILFLYIFSGDMLLAAWSPSKVSFKTRDGVLLKAYFEKPKGNAPVVICLHGLAAPKEEWTPFAQHLAQQGWGVLAYDARGHGESSKTKDMNGNPNGFQYFGKPGPGSEWEKMVNDVGAAAAFVRGEQKLQDHPIFLCGASLGANVALNYVALTRSIKGVMLLSPGMNYAEFGTEEPLKHIKGIPVLLIVSPNDQYAYQSCLRLHQIRPDVPLWTDVKSGHGVQMLDEPLMKRMFEWLQKQK